MISVRHAIIKPREKFLSIHNDINNTRIPVNMSRFLGFFIALILLAIVSLACNLGSLKGKETSPPNPFTTEAVTSLEDPLQEAQDQATNDHPVSLEITEAQLTSIVAHELQGQDEYQISDPQVYLRNGQIQMVGKLTNRNITLNAKIALTPEVDSTGSVHLHVVSASLGLFPVPENMVSDLERFLDKSFANEIESRTPNTRIESIVIQDGVMRIIGKAIK
jgi:hypothetical protein